MKAQFAPVASLSVYRQLDDYEALGEYHLLLAHKVLQEAEEHYNFYHLYRVRKPETFVIMDNSLIELKAPMPVTDLLTAVDICQAQALVLPDKLQDTNETIRLSMEGYEAILKEGRLRQGCGLLAVIQGRTKEDFLRCATTLLEQIPDIKYLSVPRVTVKDFGSRADLICELRRIDNTKPIHLLGFSDNMRDDFDCCQFPGVMGIDSAVPVRVGMQNQRFDWRTPVPPRDPDYLEGHPIIGRLVADNVKRATNWAAYGPDV